MATKQPSGLFRLKGRVLEVFGRSVTLPASRLARMSIGIAFIVGGCFSILPVLGIWMLPLGFLVLSMDIAWVRRGRRRVEVWWRRRRERQKAQRAAEP